MLIPVIKGFFGISYSDPEVYEILTLTRWIDRFRVSP